MSTDSSTVVVISSPRLPHTIGFPPATTIGGTSKAGGLISYGPNLDRFLSPVGACTSAASSKAISLPICQCRQPTKFELVINLKTAKALGLDVPPTLLARADEVIE